MNDSNAAPLSAACLEEVRRAFHAGAERASAALETWLGTPAVVSVDSVRQVPFNEAADALADGPEFVCSCSMAVTGTLRGLLIFLFDEAGGTALADLLLGRAAGDATEWSDVETSAALETANIVGCCYLNALQDRLGRDGSACELLPSPPEFRRDFAESLVESALASQMLESDVVFLAGTRFRVAGTEREWSFLFLPDADAIRALRRLLEERNP